MSDYKIAHIDSIHITTTSGATLSDSNKLDGLKTFSVSISTENVELKHLNNSEGWSDFEPVWSSGSANLEGEAKKDSVTQQVLVEALTNRTPFYVHVIDNPTATTGEKMGTRYYLSIESGEEPREAGALVTFSYSCKVKGQPVDILAA